MADEKPKRKTYTSSVVKDRYNAKAYNRIELKVPKGKKANLHDYAAGRGESLNGFVNRAIDNQVEQDATVAAFTVPPMEGGSEEGSNKKS